MSCLAFAFWSWWQEWGEAQSKTTRQATTQFPARSTEGQPIWCVGWQCRPVAVLQVRSFAQVCYVYYVHNVYIPTRVGIQYHHVVTATCVMSTLSDCYMCHEQSLAHVS